MENLYIKGEFASPEINFDAGAGLLQFGGASFPENVPSFYAPVLAWINNYLAGKPKTVSIVFNLAYINTASLKIYFQLVRQLKQFQLEGHQVNVTWNYAEDDEDMEETGQQLSKESSLDFNMVAL